MKKRQVAAFIFALSLSASFPTIAKAADLDKMAMMTCSKGDKLEILLDNQEVDWEISDESIVKVNNKGIIIVKKEGDCELEDKETGYVVKLESKGESKNTEVLELNYSTDTSELEDIVIQDDTVDVKTVEVNEVISTKAEEVPKEAFTVKKEKKSPTVTLKEESSEVVGDEVIKTFSAEGTSEESPKTDVVPKDEVITGEDVTPQITDEDSSLEIQAEKEGNFVVEAPTGESTVLKVVEPKLNQTEFVGSIGQKTTVVVTNVEEGVSYESSNPNAVAIDTEGNVDLIGGGEAVIKATTKSNTLECKITSKIPTVDTTEVKLKKEEKGHIEVVDNLANLPVTYSIVAGEGTVSDAGEVSVGVGKSATVRVTIGNNITYDKTFICSSIHEEYWDRMQPAIEECLGTPYLMGGETPGVALDCSAYASYVLRSVGLLDSRYTAQGLYDMSIKTEEPQPGDLVFFTGTYDAGCYITHVGIYAGNNEMYHSGDPNQKTTLQTNYWQSHMVGFGSFIKDDGSMIDTTAYRNSNADINYSQEELELIWAIVGQECSTNYEGALAVISCAMNRADTNYGGHGTTALSQLTAPNQFCYSPSVSDPSLWQARLGGNVPDFVKQAVSDCLNDGIRNHSFVSFRSDAAEGRVNIGDNWYFNE